jgi:hypothetical protein
MAESSSTKFKRNLEYIRKACDDLVTLGETLSNRKIAEYTKRHFNQPSYSGIRDNSNHKAYIELRKLEQINARNAPPTLESSVQNLPRDIPQLHKYIISLQYEIKTLKEMLTAHEELLKRETIVDPIKLGHSIAAGPNEDLSMKLVQVNDSINPKISTHAITAIKKLLDIGNMEELPIEYKQSKNGEMLVYSSPGETKCILTSKKLKALQMLIEPDKNKP